MLVSIKAIQNMSVPLGEQDKFIDSSISLTPEYSTYVRIRVRRRVSCTRYHVLATWPSMWNRQVDQQLREHLLAVEYMIDYSALAEHSWAAIFCRLGKCQVLDHHHIVHWMLT